MLFAPYSIAAIDLDGDGVQDLVVGSITAPYVNSLIGDGAGGFRTGYSSTAGFEARTMAIIPGTANEPPLVIAGSFHTVFSYTVKPGGVLAPYSIQFSWPFTQMITADVNGDGYPELILSGNGVGVFYIKYPSGPQPPPLVFTGSTAVGVAVADLNGDGKPDLIASTLTRLMTFNGDGLGNFVLSSDYVSADYGQLIAGNFNNGFFRPDLFVLTPTAIVFRPNCYDATAPVTTATRSVLPNANGWNRVPVTVNLAAVDNAGGSGVHGLRYSLSGAMTVQDEIVVGPGASIYVPAEGATTVTYQAIDYNGNFEQPKSLTIRIDTTAPALSGLPVPGCAIWPPNEQLVQVADVVSSDALSGINKLTVTGFASVPASGPEVPDIVVDGGKVSVRARPPKQGNPVVYTLTAVATDRADNSTSLSGTCTVSNE